jgi:hypothetical protein
VNYKNTAASVSGGDALELDMIFENALTVRVDMEPWFINYARTLYALNAYNLENMDDPTLLEKIKVRCFKPETLQAKLGLDPYELSHMKGQTFMDVLDPSKINDLDLKAEALKNRDRVAITTIDGNFYLASETKNSYVYTIFYNMVNQDIKFASSQGTSKDDILEMYRLYNLVKFQNIPDCE